MRDLEFLFLGSIEPHDFVRHHAVRHFRVRRFQETEIVDTGIAREIVDKTDVRTFRRLNRTDAAIMRTMHVAHFERRAFARRPPGPSAEILRLCSSSASGFTWSINCESWDDAKNSLMTAAIGRKLTSCAGIRLSLSSVDILSWMIRRKRARPMRKRPWRSSPTAFKRRLPKWSISSARHPDRCSTR